MKGTVVPVEDALNQEQLIIEVARRTKASQQAVARILAMAIQTIEKTVAKGEKVTLVGFGTFSPRKRSSNGTTVNSGKKIKIPNTVVPSFSAGKEFRELIVS